MGKKHSILNSFGYAFSGVKLALKEETNFRLHLLSTIIVIFFGFWLNISPFEWIALIFVIFFVLVMELVNTTVENIVDMVSPEISAKARVAKDVSAAAVLLTSILAVLVGSIIFLPKFL